MLCFISQPKIIGKGIPHVLVLVLLLSLNGCKLLVKIVNEYFPPLNTTKQQVASIKQNLLYIDSIQSDIGVYINREVLEQYLPIAIRKSAEEYSDETLEVVRFEPRISLDKQLLRTDADFELYLPKYQATIQGNLLGTSSVSTVRDSLSIRSAFETFEIITIEFKEKPTLKEKALAGIIQPLLNNFLDNVNGNMHNDPTNIYLGWEKSLKFNSKDLFKSKSTIATSSEVTIERYLKNSSILIDNDGIWMMIEVDKEALDHNPNVTVLDQQGNVDQLFKTYKEKFNNSWINSFEIIDQRSMISVVISKKVLASIFNEALSSNLSITTKIENNKENFSSKIEVENSKIDCQKVRKPFKYSRYKRKKCDWSCLKDLGFGIKTDDPACKVSRAACNAGEEAKVLADNLKYEAEKTAHNFAQESAVAACDVVREANNFLALGKFSGYTSGNGTAKLNVSSFRFNENLSQIDITYTGGIEYDLKSKIDIQPMDLGYVFLCQFNYSKSTTSHLKADIPNQTSKLSIDTHREEDNLIITSKFNAIEYKATVNPSPLHDMIVDPAFIGKCSVFNSVLTPILATAAVGSLSGIVKLSPEQELLLLGQATGKYQPDEVETEIKPIKFTINNGDEQISQIFWNEKTIKFEYQAEVSL